jgi:hypothetical protein
MKQISPRLRNQSFKRNPFSRKQLAIFSLAFVLIGGYIIFKSFAAAPTVANFWVDANGGTCTRSATPAAYNDAAACSSFDAVNDKCQNNDLALVKAGNYAYQDLTGLNSRSSACTIQGALGETVHVAAMTVESGSGYLTFKDMSDISGATINGSLDCSDQSVCLFGDHVTLDNFDITGPYAQLDINGCDGCTLKNSNFGTSGNTTSLHCPASGAPQSKGAPLTSANNTNLLIDHNNFWQFFGEDPACGTHLETMRFWDSNDGVTISNNYFAPGGGDDTSRISSSQTDSFPDNKNMYILNNYFGELQAGHAAPDMIFGDNHACNHFVFAYNFMANGITDYCSSDTNMWAIGNTGGNSGGCLFGGSGAVNVGYHLTASSPAINAGENTYCSSLLNNLDIDGGTRTGVCDAGPDEFGATQGPPDTTPPTVSITAPAAGATIASVTTVSANAADNIGVAGVQFKVDGNIIGSEDTSSPYSVSWDPAALSNGSHTLTAVARDAAGNTTTSSGVVVTVNNPPDTTPPTVSISSPTAGATVSGSVTVSANASDNAAVAGVQFKLDGANLQAEDTSSPYSVNWDTTSTSNGSHTLTAVARDGAGNTTTSTPVSVTVTNVSPGAFLLGNQTIEALADTLASQQAQAFPYTSTGAGNVGTASVYIDSTNTAQGVLIGLYSDSSGSPGSLLATATISNPVSGWNTAPLSSSPTINSGAQYWIALLGTGTGTLAFRDRSGGPCISKVNAAPNNWTSMHNPFGATGGNFTFCPASAYISAAASTGPKPADINSDGKVDITDLSYLLSSYGQNTTQCITNAAYKCDLSTPADGIVNIFDLSILLSGYGK